jgi:hypothetical protein
VELVREGARFLIVGGFAVHAYRPERDVTGADIDLLIDRSTTTAAIVARIVGKFEMATIESEGLRRPKTQLAAKRFLNMDVLTLAEGDDFESRWHGATRATVNGTEVRVISLDRLRRMKEFGAREGRANDARDLALLGTIPSP